MTQWGLLSGSRALPDLKTTIDNIPSAYYNEGDIVKNMITLIHEERNQPL